MKRASYRAAIRFIAMNDSAGDDLTVEDCGSLVTAVLVAEIFDVDSDTVGKDIDRKRRQLEKLRRKSQPGGST
jgi:hypothetical protein